MTGESEMAAFAGEGIERFTPSGGINWRGSIFHSNHQPENWHIS
jgi:hypothetical protein